MLKILRLCKRVNFTTRNISLCRYALNEEKPSKRKVKETVELVMFVDQDDKILGLKPKTECEMLAKKLNFVLERVNDAKYGKMYPAYKLFSASDLLPVEKKKSVTYKALKKLPLNCRISDNDLAIKIQIIKRWLAKNCEVHVAILSNNDAPKLMKSVFVKIQDLLKDECRMLDIRNKETAIKFIVVPPKQTDKKAVPKNKNDISDADKDDANKV